MNQKINLKVLGNALLLVLLFGCRSVPVPSLGQTAVPVWTGFLEGETLDIAPQVGGRIVRLAVEEGQQVTQGQLLFVLDDDLVQKQIQVADANIAAAQAQLALVKAGARAEDIAGSDARAQQARAALDAASQAEADARAIRSNPQALGIARAQAKLAAQVAAAQLDIAVKQAQAADLQSNFWQDRVRDLWDGVDIRLPDGTTRHFDTPSGRMSFAQDQWNQASHQAWQAWTAVDAAKANQDSTAAALKDIADQMQNPIALDARVSAAVSARERAAAAYQAAQAAAQAVREGASPAQIQAASSAVDQARAARATLDGTRSNYVVNAPRAGTVKVIYFRQGEVAGSGSAVVQLSAGGPLTLRVFVPMAQLQAIRVGQELVAWLPEAGNREAKGQVTRIADQAEFTARQPQTDDERNAQLVAVEITLAGSDPEIKAGMPASVSFAAGGQPPQVSVASADIGPGAGMTFSGSVEERQTLVASEIEAQVQAVNGDKGDTVKAGDVLVTLDDARLRDAQREADAAVSTARANLDTVQEPARPGALAIADAAVAQANAEADAAHRALADADRALAAPQEIDAQVHAWEGKVQAAEVQVKSAQVTISDLNRQIDQAANDSSQAGKTRVAILNKQLEAADAGRDLAQATVDGSGQVLALYRALAASPLELVAARNGAAGQVAIAEAGRQVAAAESAIARRGPQLEAVAAAQAKMQAAQAAADLVRAQAKRYTMLSPVSGRIVARQVQPGETARPGLALLTIADTSRPEVTVFVPVGELGRVQPGHTAAVRLPSLPGKTYLAAVTYIAPEAEFKPANIYNSQDRSELVYAVRVTISQPDADLKAGLPADVTFQ